ncbi:hypothetical protein AYK61_13470 [Rhodococcus sp. SBT000017]|uniref:hypothetical protein n=1 Tax=Rhodococcus sp. SBT000017 TaxID=1803385 RepID=UPI000EF946A4|nr:hypothetical protein [Rhodococcus sp. SBT000017]RMB77338.1 hypothetical protein AYK61_13470 [Rhodococcus sp. SBT000017]
MTEDLDTTMTAIVAAATEGRVGDSAGARRSLLGLWNEIGTDGDALHRCTLAHYLADLYDDPAQALAWNIRALDAADALTGNRVRRHHRSLYVAGFYPSLHLNLAEDYRRLASFEAAGAHIDSARRLAEDLPDDSYGTGIRDAITDIAEAIARRDSATDARQSAS